MATTPNEVIPEERTVFVNRKPDFLNSLIGNINSLNSSVTVNSD